MMGFSVGVTCCCDFLHGFFFFWVGLVEGTSFTAPTTMHVRAVMRKHLGLRLPAPSGPSSEFVI